MVYYQFNNDNAVSIRAQVSGSTYHYPNKTPSDIYTAYDSVSSRKNNSYNTIVMTKYSDGEYYGYVYGIHLPTDKIIDIDTETHDYIAFHWDNMAGTGNVTDDWGSNCLYAHQARINSDDTNFSLNGTIYNQYGGSGHYTVDGKYWIYTSWWGFSENTPIQIYTTVPLYNIRVNGEPVIPIITETLKTPRNTSLIEINTAIRDIKTALLHKYGRDDIEDPVVNSIEISNYVDATIYYKIDTRIIYPYEYCKLVIKKNAIPVNKEDGDKILDVSPYNIKIKVTDLDDSSRYFVKIFVEDTNGTIAMSAAKVFKTGTIYNFDYTGQIQTFVVPETGIYSLETWGAQGGNAEDGNNSARGGYGSYSYGEIALQKGETLYINVGGQNGYGGGGYSINPPDEYKSYIDTINGSGASFIDTMENTQFVINGYTYDKYPKAPMRQYSYYPLNDGADWNAPASNYPIIASDKIDTIYITVENNIATVTITQPHIWVNGPSYSGGSIVSDKVQHFLQSVVTSGGKFNSANVGYYKNESSYGGYGYYAQVTDSHSWSTKTFTGTLAEVFSQLDDYVRNVNIFVNDECWALIENVSN